MVYVYVNLEFTRKGEMITKTKLFMINIVTSVAYLWASAFSFQMISKTFLIITLASFLFALTKIENSNQKNTLFLSRAMIMLPILLLFGNIRFSLSILSNSILILIILCRIAYDFFWKNREACKKRSGAKE